MFNQRKRPESSDGYRGPIFAIYRAADFGLFWCRESHRDKLDDGERAREARKLVTNQSWASLYSSRATTLDWLRLVGTVLWYVINLDSHVPRTITDIAKCGYE